MSDHEPAFDVAAVRGVFEGLRPTGPSDPLRALYRYARLGTGLPRRKRFQDLCEEMARRGDPLLCAATAQLQLLSFGSWIRDPRDWSGSRGGEEERVASLARHLMARYDVPRFLDTVFSRGLTGLLFVRLFEYVARGRSMRLAVRHGLLPRTMTRRAQHIFLRTPRYLDVIEGIRRAQVLSYGGTPELAREIALRFGRTMSPDEPRLASILRWLVAHPMPTEHVVPALDYVHHQLRYTPEYSLRGRTAASLLRAMHAWHDRLAPPRYVLPEHYEPSGFEGASFEIGRDRWTAREILTGADLQAEGNRQRHCVVTYSSDIVCGRCSIWVLESDGSDQKSHVTIEVDNESRTIVQARRAYNALPDRRERLALECWAACAGLRIRI